MFFLLVFSLIHLFNHSAGVSLLFLSTKQGWKEETAVSAIPFLLALQQLVPLIGVGGWLQDHGDRHYGLVPGF